MQKNLNTPLGYQSNSSQVKGHCMLSKHSKDVSSL